MFGVQGCFRTFGVRVFNLQKNAVWWPGKGPLCPFKVIFLKGVLSLYIPQPKELKINVLVHQYRPGCHWVLEEKRPYWLSKWFQLNLLLFQSRHMIQYIEVDCIKLCQLNLCSIPMIECKVRTSGRLTSTGRYADSKYCKEWSPN